MCKTTDFTSLIKKGGQVLQDAMELFKWYMSVLGWIHLPKIFSVIV